MNVPFGATSTAQQREAQRAERERERLEKERLEREEQNQLSEEQRDEIREAVYIPSPSIRCACREGQGCSLMKLAWLRSSANLSPLLGRAEQFDLFDLDKDQRIDYHEFKVALKALGFDLPKPEILQLLQTHGAPQESSAQSPQRTRLLLSFPAFKSIMTSKILARDPREEVMRAFDLFDEGGKGKINLADLRRVARELGEGLEEEELVAMIEEFDLDGDGAIDREDFLGICLQ